MILLLILLQIIFQIPAYSGEPTLFEFEVGKPTSDCTVDSVRVILPHKSGTIDTVFATKVRVGKEMYDWVNHSYEYWQVLLVGFRCGEYKMLTQAFIPSKFGGNSLMVPGLFDVKIYPELSLWQRSYMRMRNAMSRSAFLRRQGWTEIDAMFFCKDKGIIR